VWESLAIGEYLNDIKPEAGLWPAAVAVLDGLVTGCKHRQPAALLPPMGS
jgi:hypothetical protein